MVVCYEVAQLEKAAEAAKHYLASAVESDPFAAARRYGPGYLLSVLQLEGMR